ncbi:MAG: hypothetical protein Q4D11_05685, partial [Rhodospirillales bacterium]|nr:hypothetical protein [Rhodospirillales bacterium]
MKKISPVMVALLSSTFLSAPALAEWTPENKDGSAYNITAGTASDYNFTTTDGATTSYWKINLNADNFSTSDSISWSTDSIGSTGSVEVQLPNNKTKTLYYTYTKPANYTETNSRIENVYEGNATSKLFKNIEISSSGGAVYTDANGDNIASDFIGNSASGNGNIDGGAVNIYSSYGDTFGDVTGDFIDNHADSDNGVAHGGAISTNSRVFGNVTGDFINNGTSGTTAFGGAIYRSSSYGTTFGDITGNFIGNQAQGTNDAYGGAIYGSSTTFGDITGNFIDNHAEATNYATGGAISASELGNISGDFIGNSASGNSAAGGALSTNFAENATGNFIGNHVQGKESAVGGAIYSYSSYGGAFGNITGDFIGNYAVSDEGEAHGGAIFGDYTFIGISAKDGNTSLFSGNYVQNSNGDKDYEAIYMNEGELYLSTSNNGSITFDDKINGSNYDLNIYGDGTGVVKFNNEVKGVTNFTLGENSITHLGMNSKVYAENMIIDNSATLIVETSPIITVDVEVDKGNNTVNAGQIHVDNDIEGDYRV